MSDASNGEELKRTPLHEEHARLDARMVPFGGFAMPVQYPAGIQEEHRAVRSAAGLFDISHMGEFRVRGPDAVAFVSRATTNDPASLSVGQAQYSAMCLEDGGIVDDLVVYRLGEEDLRLVVNAANIDKDWRHLQGRDEGLDVELEDESGDVALLALQGPRAQEILEELTPVELDPVGFYRFTGGEVAGVDAIVSRTGYTGEDGFELYVSAGEAPGVWRAVLEAGEDRGLQPAGLGARDTLRLEAGYCLYGNDITTETHPFEAGLGWIVKLDAGDFIGRDALRDIKDAGIERKLVGFIVEGRGIPRHDHPIQDTDGAVIGTVTSGSQSPVLDQGIGLGYVPNEPVYTEPGQPLQIDAGRRTLNARVAKPPFHKD